MLELLKVIVQPVVIERDDEGCITGEQVGQAVSLYTQEQVEEFFSVIREQLAVVEVAEE